MIALGLLAVGAALAQAATPRPGPWVQVAVGKMGPYSWTVEVHRPGGPAGAGSSGAKRPCLSVSATWRVGRFDYQRSKYRQCTGRSGALRADEPPLIASAGQPSTGAEPKMTAVGMLFAPAARRVRVTFVGGRETTLHLRRLKADEARRGRLAPLRYAAFVVRGAWCAERVVTEGAAGRLLWDSGVDEYTCSGSGQPLP